VRKRQRLAVRGLLAAAGLRRAWHQAGALHPWPAARTRQDRAVLSHRPQPVPGRAGRPGRRAGRWPGRAEPAAGRLGRDRLPPRVHSETGAPPLRRWQEGLPTRCPAPPRATARGVLWAEHRTATPAPPCRCTQHLPGRPATLRPQGRAGLRPLRPHRHPSPPPAAHLRQGSRVPDRPPRPPQGPPRTARHHTPPPTGIDYLRLLQVGHQQQLAHRINYAALAHDIDADGHHHPQLGPADRHDPTAPAQPAPDDGHTPGQLTLAQPDHANPDQERQAT
jgi:hypothetical protein